jgi:hypothetical protein
MHPFRPRSNRRSIADALLGGVPRCFQDFASGRRSGPQRAPTERVNVAGGIEVAVESQPAGEAFVNADGQILGHLDSATRAAGACSSRINLHDPGTSLFRFVPKRREKDPPTSVRDRFAETQTLHHATNVETFDAHGIVALVQGAGELASVVEPLILDMRMSPGYQETSSPVCSRALLGSRHGSLPAGQQCLPAPVPARVGDGSAVGRNREVSEPQINPDLPKGRPLLRLRTEVTGKADILPAVVLSDLGLEHSALQWSISMEPQSTELGEADPDPPAEELDRLKSCSSDGAQKPREARLLSKFHPAEEGLEGTIKPAEWRACDNHRDRLPMGILCAKLGELGGLIMVRDRMARSLPSPDPVLKGPVEQGAAEVEPAAEGPVALAVHMERVPVGPNHRLPSLEIDAIR